MAGCERKREIRRRRKRRVQVLKLRKRAVKSSGGDKALLAAKLRRLTPGADVILADLGI